MIPYPWLRPPWPTLEAPAGGFVRSLVGHSAHVNDLALSPDGRLAVSASDDTTLKVWEVASGRELRTLIGHRDRVMVSLIFVDDLSTTLAKV